MNLKIDLYMSLERVRCKHEIWYALALAVLTIGFYFLYQFGLFACDDFRYACTPTGGRLKSFSGVFERELYDYNNVNGRFVIHSIVSIFAGLGGMQIYHICGSLLFALLLASLSFLCVRRKNIGSFPVLIVIMFLCNVTFKAFLGNIAFSTNYLWSSAFVLTFVALLYSRRIDNENIFAICGCFVYGVFSGALQETFSVGCSVASFLYFIYYRKQLSPAKKSLLLGFCLGAAFLLLAPGGFKRQGGMAAEGSWFISHFMFLGRVICDCYILIPLIALLFWSYYRERERTIQFFKQNAFFFIAIIVNIFFAVIVFYAGRRQMLCQIFFSIVILWRWFQVFYPNIINKTKNILSVLSLGIIIVAYLPIYQYRSEVYAAYSEMIHNSDSNTGVIVSKWFDNVSYMHRNVLRREFTYTEMDDRMQMDAYSRWFSDSDNKELFVLRLPDTKENIMSVCTIKNEISTGVYHDSNTFYYIIKINDCYEEQGNDLSVSVIQKATNGEYVKNLLSRKPNPQESITELPIMDYPHFFENGCCYCVVMFLEDYPIKEVKLDRKSSC